MSVKSEFRLRMVGFEDVDIREVYLLHSSSIVSTLSLVGRCVSALYFVVVLILSGLSYDTPKWPVFLTNWNVVIYTAYFIAGMSLSLHLWFTQRKSNLTANKDAEEMPSRYGAVPPATPTVEPITPLVRVVGVMVWMLMEVSMVLSFIIVLLYWVLLTWIFAAGYLKYTDHQEQFVEINTHGINLLIAIRGNGSILNLILSTKQSITRAWPA